MGTEIIAKGKTMNYRLRPEEMGPYPPALCQLVDEGAPEHKVRAEVRRQKRLREIKECISFLDKAKTPMDIVKVQIALDTLETLMEKAGLFTVEERRPANEGRIRARAKLGRLLEKMVRAPGPGRGKKISETQNSFMERCREIGLDKNRASEVQRIGAIPDEVLTKRFKERESKGELTYITMAIEWSQPFWKIKHRSIKHARIRQAATASKIEIGPFTLIYADPPWRFETYSESGGGKSPDQHYPTLADDEIISFEIGNIPISEIAYKDAVLFLWCTSSNIPLALRVMEGWGFNFRSSAVWVKPGIGTGLIFRNRHEVLLYGTRGKMPGPVIVPPSVFEYPKRAHSEKPAEIRKIIERMFPAFTADERLELFHRGEASVGWTTYGNESRAARPAA